MLPCCDYDGEMLSVLEFFAVGKTFRALFWCAVKGGGHCQFLNISVIYKVHLRRVPRPSVFINHLTLPVLGIFSTHIIRHGQAKDKDTDKKKKRREEQRSNAVPPSANGVSIPVMKV